MPYRPGDAYYGEFCTSRFDTGAVTTADSLPSVTANHNGTDDGTFVLTAALVDTGRYKVTGTIPSGYAGFDVVNVSASATVNSVAGKAVIDSFVLAAAGSSAPAVDSAGRVILQPAEHTLISGTDVTLGLTTQGYTTTRAGYLDTLNGLVAAIWNALTSGFSTAGSIGLKLKNWVLGTDNKSLLSTDAQTGVTLPTVTAITNAVTTIFDSMLVGSTIASASTASVFSGQNTLSASNSAYQNADLVFTSGANAGQTHRIASYNGSTQTFTMANPFTATPTAGDAFKIVGRVE